MWTFSLDDRKPTRFGDVSSSGPINSVFSPDGRWIVYRTAETGPYELYAQPFPRTGVKYQIAKGGNGQPLWSADGKEILYDPLPGQFVSVAVATTQGFVLGNPVHIVRRFRTESNVRTHDILPDGRFIAVSAVDAISGTSGPTPQIQIVLNWFADIRQRTAKP